MLANVKSWWSPNSTQEQQQQQQDEKDKKQESPDAEQAPSNPDEPSDGQSTGHEEELKKVLGQAKDWGNYLYSFSKKATTTVTSKAKQLAATPNIIEDFERQNRDFVSAKQDKAAKAEAAVPPWVGYDNEEQLKQQILALSQDTRNFLRSPPQGANYQFDMDAHSKVAMATLEVDENLKKMRFELVPKRVKEIDFWRNYFYRISLISQSAQLSSLAKATGQSQQQQQQAADQSIASNSSNASEGYEKLSPEPDRQRADSDECSDFASTELAEQQPAKLSEAERMKLGNDTAAAAANDEDWEQELQRELKEFELVTNSADAAAADAADAGQAANEDEELEREIMQQLADEA